MNIKLLREGIELELDTSIETELALNIGDKIIINEYLTHFKLDYGDGVITLIEPNGTIFKIHGLERVFEHNGSLSTLDINKNI